MPRRTDGEAAKESRIAAKAATTSPRLSSRISSFSRACSNDFSRYGDFFHGFGGPPPPKHSGSCLAYSRRLLSLIEPSRMGNRPGWGVQGAYPDLPVRRNGVARVEDILHTGRRLAANTCRRLRRVSPQRLAGVIRHSHRRDRCYPTCRVPKIAQRRLPLN